MLHRGPALRGVAVNKNAQYHKEVAPISKRFEAVLEPWERSYIIQRNAEPCLQKRALLAEQYLKDTRHLLTWCKAQCLPIRRGIFE